MRRPAGRRRSFPTGGIACVVGIGVNCAERARGRRLSDRRSADRERRRRSSADALFASPGRALRRSACAYGGRAKRSRAIRAAWLAHADAPRRAHPGRGRASDGGRGLSRGLTATAVCCFAGSRGSRRIETADLWILPAIGWLARDGFVRFACAGRPRLNDRRRRIRVRAPRGLGRNWHELRALRLRSGEGAQMADGRSRRRLCRRRAAGRRSRHAGCRLHREGEEGPCRHHPHPCA